MNDRELILEARSQANLTPRIGPMMITPPIDEDYWSYRVQLSDTQAIVGFPKFGTIGIGFAQEEDWNTNLPYTSGAEEIFQHIRHNKGDESIPDTAVLAAIRVVQSAARIERERGASTGVARPRAAPGKESNEERI